LWELFGRLEVAFVLPPVSAVVAGLPEMVLTRQSLHATSTTVEAFATGMALAIGCGIVMGVAMGRLRFLDRLLGMWVDLFVGAPLTALVQVLMILFGLGQTTITAAVFLFAVWIIALDTRAGVRQVPTSLVEMGRCFGASRWQLLSRLILPSALPEIRAGTRVGVIRGAKGVVVGQLLVSIIGYGEMFELCSRNFLMAHFWALAILLFAFALLTSEAIAVFERRVQTYAAVRHR
jgi:NitT/TauT family transport system permease protein